jgi:hypothetical protein
MGEAMPLLANPRWFRVNQEVAMDRITLGLSNFLRTNPDLAILPCMHIERRRRRGKVSQIAVRSLRPRRANYWRWLGSESTQVVRRPVEWSFPVWYTIANFKDNPVAYTLPVFENGNLFHRM